MLQICLVFLHKCATTNVSDTQLNNAYTALQNNVSYGYIIDSCYGTLDGKADVSDSRLCVYTDDGDLHLRKNVKIRPKDMDLYTQEIACNVYKVFAILNEAQCMQQNDMNLYNLAVFVERWNAWSQISSYHEKMMKLAKERSKAKSQHNSGANRAYKGHIRIARHKKEHDDTCYNIKIRYKLNEDDDKILRTAHRLILLMQQNNEDTIANFANINKLSLRHLVCPTNEIKIIIAEIHKFLVLKNSYDCLKRFVKDNETEREKHKTKMDETEQTLQFLQEYIDLLDTCLQCVKSSLTCAFVDTTYNATNPSPCHVILPYIQENAATSYSMYNHYKIMTSQKAKENPEQHTYTDTYDASKFTQSIDDRFHKILQTLTTRVEHYSCDDEDLAIDTEVENIAEKHVIEQKMTHEEVGYKVKNSAIATKAYSLIFVALLLCCFRVYLFSSKNVIVNKRNFASCTISSNSSYLSHAKIVCDA